MVSQKYFTNRIVATLASRNWHLVAQDSASNWMDFVNQVNDVVDAHVSDDRLFQRAVTYAYCPILLAACQEDGSDRQERAFTELHQWIYPRVYARIGNSQDAEDVAQKVLMLVYKNLHRVEKPHGFLGYVSVIIRHEVVDYYRRKGKNDQFEWYPPGNGDDDDDNGKDDLVGPDSFLDQEIDAAEEYLIRMIYECMPRKKWRRAKVLVALTLLEQTATEVAESLQITANAVYMLHFQAKKDLPQHCPELIELILQRLTPSQRLRLQEGNS